MQRPHRDFSLLVWCLGSLYCAYLPAKLKENLRFFFLLVTQDEGGAGKAVVAFPLGSSYMDSLDGGVNRKLQRRCRVRGHPG